MVGFVPSRAVLILVLPEGRNHVSRASGVTRKRPRGPSRTASSSPAWIALNRVVGWTPRRRAAAVVLSDRRTAISEGNTRLHYLTR